MTDDSTTSVAEEIAAEIQTAAGEEIDRLQKHREAARAIESTFRDANLITATKSDAEEIRISSVATDSATRPAFSGLLYGVVAVRIDMTLDGTKIVDISQDSRSQIELCDFGDSSRRVRWNERQLATELLTGALSNPKPPEILIYDDSLTITRQDMLTYQASPAKSNWEELLRNLDKFWDEEYSDIYPWDTEGPVIMGISRMRANLLMTSLRGKGSKSDAGMFIVPVPSSLRESIDTNWETISNVGPNRLVDMMLKPNERTIPYPYSASNLDRRWLPEKLKTLDVQGIFFKPNRNTNPLHIELPGESNVHPPDGIEDIFNTFTNLFWLRDVDVPVPVWYAREKAEFPSELLDLYYKRLRTDSKTNT